MDKSESNHVEVEYKEVGVVQSHGCLLVIRQDSCSIVAISQNAQQLLLVENPCQLIGKGLHALFGQKQGDYLCQLLTMAHFSDINPFQIAIEDKEGTSRSFDVAAQRQSPYIFLEIEPIPAPLPWGASPHKMLKSSIHRLQNTASLSDLSKVTCEEVRKITGYQRVMICQFDMHSNWLVVAEDKEGNIPSFQDFLFPYTDMSFPQMETYVQNHTVFLPRVGSEPSPLYVHEQSDLHFNLRWLQLANVPQKDIQYLQDMGIASAYVLPIIKNHQPWGMIMCHHQQEHHPGFDMRSASDLLVSTFAGQLTLREEAEVKHYTSEKAKKLNELIESISSKGKFTEALLEKQQALLNMVSASGGAIYFKGELQVFGITPPSHKIMEIIDWLAEEVEENVYITDHLPIEFAPISVYRRFSSGLISISLTQHPQHCILWFKPEVDRVIKWAGVPPIKYDIISKDQSQNRLPIKDNPTGKRTFEPWLETVHSHSTPWNEIDFHHVSELRKIINESIFRQLQESAEWDVKFQLLFQNSSDVQLILEKNLDVKFVSGSLERVLGYKIEDFKGDWANLIHPEDRADLNKKFRDLIEKNQSKIEMEYRIRHEKGHYVHFETIATNFLENPNIQGIICNSRDITSRVLDRDNLKKFQKAIEASTNGVMIVDAVKENYPVIYANPSYTELTGFTQEETLNKPCPFFLKDEGGEPEEYAKLVGALSNRQECAVLLKNKKKNGSYFWNQIQVAPIYDDRGEIKSFIAIISDFSYRKTYEEKITEYASKLHISNQELQTFAYVASHDLQEPLRTISGFTELLAESYEGKLDEEGDEYIKFILMAADRMKNLIQDLLQFSRVSTEKGFITEVSFNDILNKTIENLHTLIEENKAVITYDSLPVLMVNETLIIQVVQNLLTNAIKYQREEQVRVHVSAREEKGQWLFSVEDNGIGIEEKYYERIFVIFQRLHTKEQYRGTGIGLAICKKIIEKYGGQIWVKSQLGIGSIFYFTLPKVPVFK